MNRMKCSKIGFVFGTALLGALTGCVGHVRGPHHAQVYVQPPSVHVEAPVVVQDDYVYYPSHQVYYSSHRRHYVYLEGSAWVSRPTPPRVSVDVLFASPSVRLDFHDSPSIHHARVVRQYPKHWSPAGSNHGWDGRDEGPGEGNKGNKGKGKGKGNKGNKGRD